MKLTNILRDAFVRAAMNDVPTVDHNEAARKVLQAAAIRIAPPTVRALYKSSPEWVNTAYVSTPRGLSNVHVICPAGEDATTHIRKHAAEVMTEVDDLAKAEEKQKQGHIALERNLRAVAYSVTTRKALAAMLPEFEKYLPADEPAAIKTLPAVANIVAEFTKAGWPKGKKPAAKTI